MLSQRYANTLCLCWHKFAKNISVLNGIKIKIMHSITPVNLHLSISVMGNMIENNVSHNASTSVSVLLMFICSLNHV